MELIRKYLEEEKKMSPVILERTIAKLERHADIVEEFKLWIETKEYKTDTTLQIEGYTAEDIFKIAPFLDGLGIFNFLVTLREQPEKAKAHISAGFPRKLWTVFILNTLMFGYEWKVRSVFNFQI